jgi:hypothetical protein
LLCVFDFATAVTIKPSPGCQQDSGKKIPVKFTGIFWEFLGRVPLDYEDVPEL